MKGTIEFFVIIIVFALMALSGTAFITATINTSNARDYHASVVNEIEESNFNTDVINGLYTDASGKGYSLEPITVTEIENHRKVAEVVLDYTYDVGILNITGERHSIRGYAR